MVSVSYFGVRVSVMFHLMFVHDTFSSVWFAEWRLLSGHLLGNSCPLAYQFVCFLYFVYL